MMFLPLLIGAAVAAAPAPARPETDAGKLAAAPAAAHRPYDFREEEEQNEFRRMKELLENDTPESAAELRAILTRQLEREIAFTAARRTYFESKYRRAEHSVKAWKSDPDRVVENHLKTVLASAAMNSGGHGRAVPGVRRPVHNSETLEAERSFRKTAAEYRKTGDEALLGRLRSDIRREMERRAEETPRRLPELRKAAERAGTRLAYLKSRKNEIIEQRVKHLFEIARKP